MELGDGTLLMSLRGAYAEGHQVNMSPLRRQIKSTDGGGSWQPVGRLIHAFGNASCFGSLARAGSSLIFSHPYAHGKEATCWKHGPPSGWQGLARCNGTLFTSRDDGETWQVWEQATAGNSSQLFAYSDLTVLETEPPSVGLFYETSSVNGGCEGPSCSLMWKRFALPPVTQASVTLDPPQPSTGGD